MKITVKRANPTLFTNLENRLKSKQDKYRKNSAARYY